MNELDLAHRIRALRRAAGITQKQAARNANVTPLGWSRWENAHFAPKSYRMGEIANAIGVPVSALYAPEGTHAIADIVITARALDRIEREGAPEIRALTHRIATNLEPALRTAAANHASTSDPAPIARRVRERPPRRPRSRTHATADDSNTS